MGTIESQGSIGQTIRSLRKRRYLTQAELAQAAGVSMRTVQSAEAGTQPRPSTARAIAKALGVDVDVLTSQETG